MSSEGTIRCPHCGKEHPQETIYCPESGMPVYPLENEPAMPARRWNPWIIAGAAAGVVVLCFGAVMAVLLLRKTFAATAPAFTQPLIVIPTLLQPSATPEPTLTSQPPVMETTAAIIETATPDSSPWQACMDAVYLSRLQVGEKARVSEDPPLANRVRSQPSLNGKVLGYIEPGEEVAVLEGPGCSSGWVWWRVRADETGLEGWTAEGDDEGYWLVPVTP